MKICSFNKRRKVLIVIKVDICDQASCETKHLKLKGKGMIEGYKSSWFEDRVGVPDTLVTTCW